MLKGLLEDQDVTAVKQSGPNLTFRGTLAQLQMVIKEPQVHTVTVNPIPDIL